MESFTNASDAPPSKPGDLVIDVIDGSSKAGCRRASLATMFTEANGKQDNSTGASLHFRGVECWVRLKRGKKHVIISDCNGSLISGTVTAIMGPSGAGKTTLLDALGQRVHIVKSKKLVIGGRIGLNRAVLTPALFRRDCAYVPQHDVLWAVLTVREHFLYSVAFKQGGIPKEESVVDKMIELLGLNKCANVIAGGAFLKGCSGGQQRRTSIGIEILSQPRLLLLDEPTSGLDAHSALNITNILSYLARRVKITIVQTIHQPSTYVWEAFDSIMILSGGATTYLGPPGDFMLHAKKHGHEPDRSHINPADYALALVCQDFSDASGSDGASRVEGLIEAWRSKELRELQKVDFVLVKALSPTGLWPDFRTLMGRAITCLLKDPILLYGRIAMSIGFGVFFGVINSKVERRQADVVGWMVVCVFEGGFLPLLSILMIPALAMDSAIVAKEIGNGTYRVSAYCAVATCVELVSSAIFTFFFLIPVFIATNQIGFFHFYTAYVGASLVTILYDAGASFFGLTCPHFIIGMGVASCNMTSQWLFNGFFIALTSMPAWVRWLHWISPMKYVHEILLTATFRGYNWGVCEWAAPCYNTGSENPFEEEATGKDLLRTLGTPVPGYPDYAVHDVNVFRHSWYLVCYIVAYRLAFIKSAQDKLVA